MAHERGRRKCGNSAKRTSSQRHMTAREQSGNGRVTRYRRHQGEVVEEETRGAEEEVSRE